MLNLDSIKFTADTSELDLASKKLDALGVAITGLSVDLSKLDKSSSTAAKAQAEANLANAKAEAIISKTAKATKDKADADDQATKAVKENTSVLERQQSILEFMTQGFSKGQSSTLAYAKSTGILTNDLLELQSVLQSQRTLIGGDPFDRSLGALKSLQNEFKVLKEVQRLYNAEIPITQKQMENLALDKLRLIEAMKIEGKSMTEIKNAIRDLNADYIGLASNINRIASADDALVKSNQDSAKAMGFLSREMERVDNVLTGFNNNLNVTSSNRLLKFREQLKLSGVDAVTAANMLKTYEDRLKTISATSSNNSKNKREDELKYLARATSVQLGDIGISLAGGQNPLLVLIQQGDQLRGVLNQVGASGNEMQKALSMAFGQIVNGSKDVVMALGSFVVGAFVDSGRAVANFGANILGVSGAIERLKTAKFAEWAAEGEAGFSKISKAMRVSELAMTALGVGIGAFVALAVASSVALLQVTNANDKLSTSLIATGAQLGFTTEYAQELATVLTGMGATRVDVLNTFSEISKAGNIASESFLQVAEAALAIERVGGPAVKETVALMGQLKEKSVETLTKYAEQTGLITTAQIAYVFSLADAGKEISATTEATNILTAAIKEQAKITYASLSSMGRLWVDLKTDMNDAWGSLQDFVSSNGLLDAMAWSVGRVAANFLEVMYQLSRGPRLMSEAAATAVALTKDVGNLDTNFTEFKNIRASINEVDKERQDAHEKQKRRLLQEGEFSAENIKREAQAAADMRKRNSEDAAGLERKLATEKLIKDEYEKHDKKTLTRQEFINKAIEDKNKLLREGTTLSKEQAAIVEKTAKMEWDKANKPKNAPKSDAMKGAEADASWYRKAIERIDTLKNQTIGVVEQLTKAQVLLMNLGDDDSFKKLSAQQQMRLVDRINEISEIEHQLALEKEIAKISKEKVALQQDLTKAQEDNSKFLEKEDAAIEKIVNTSKQRLELLGKSEDQQFAINEKYELQNKLNETGLRFDQQRLKIKQDYDKLLSKAGYDSHIVEEERAKAIEEVNKQEAQTRDALMVESANKFEAEYLKKVFNVGKNLADAITTALFEGGQAGTKKLKDYIVSIFREKINIQVNAVVNSFLNSATGSLFGGGSNGGSSGSSALGSASNLSSLYGYGKTVLSTIGRWFGLGGGASAASGLATTGTSYAASSVLASPTITSAGVGVGGSAGASSMAGFAGIPVVGWIAMGMMASANAYDEGFRTFNKGGEGFTVSDGGLLGPNGMIGGIDKLLTGIGLDPKIASILTGSALGAQAMYTVLGGYKVSAAGGGITGTLGTTGASAQARTDYTQDHRGFLGVGSYTTHNSSYSALDGGTQAVLDGGVKATTAAVKAYAKAIGLSADAVNGFTQDINIDLTGLDAEGVQKKLVETFSGFGDAMVTNAYGSALEGFSKSGETSTQTLERLASSLGIVNANLAQLDITLLPISAKSASWASGLIDAFGGVEAMQSSVSAYYDAIYTDAERVTKSTENLDAQFAALGLSVPANEAAFRKLVEGMDITTSEGQKLTASVIELAPAFAQASQAAKDAANDMMSAISNWGSSEDLRRFKAEQIQKSLSASGLDVSLDQVMGSTKDSVIAFYNSLDPNSVQAKALLANQQAIYDFVTTVKQGVGEGWGGSIGSSGSSSISDASDRAVDSIINAWKSITDAIWGEVKRIRGLLQESSGNSLELAKQEFEKATAAARSGNQEAAAALPELSQTLLTIAQGQASTLIELRRAQALTANSLEKTVTGLASTYGLTVPAFANGGSYSGGMALVGEDGPELINFNQGGYVHNAGQTASMLGGSDELISEIRRLNSKVEQLEAAAISTAVSNSKLLKLFERVTPDGTTVAISGTVKTV